MIIFYFPNKRIHQIVPGFGSVSELNGEYWIDGWNTTTKTSDVQWKYIDEQKLETDESGAYLHGADYYETVDPLPSAESRLAAIEMYLLEQEIGL